MGFRDDLEAARARIDTLDRELAEHRRQKRASKSDTPPFAFVSVVLFVVLIGLGVGIAFEWNRAEEALATAVEWRRMEGETAVALEETRHRLRDVQQRRVHSVPVRAMEMEHRTWNDAADPMVETWTAVVHERIGDAPAPLGAECTARLAHIVTPGTWGAPDACELHVSCAGALYPRGAEVAAVQCYLDGDGHLVTLGSFVPTYLRARGTSDTLRIDDGPDGTWSLVLDGNDP